MANRFYTDDILRPGEYSLTGPEAHHLTAVRRGAIGDTIVLFNGDGREYPAEIVSLGKKSVGLIVGESCVVDRELGFPFEVACAMPKVALASLPEAAVSWPWAWPHKPVPIWQWSR